VTNHEDHEGHEGCAFDWALRRNETGNNKPHLIHGGLLLLVSFLREPPAAAGLLCRPGQSNASS
jgi:hypothetical protein